MWAACLKLEAEDDDRLKQVDLAPARSIPLCLHFRRALLAAFELPATSDRSRRVQGAPRGVPSCRKVRSDFPKPT
jgi:hypothetical protein